MGRAGYYRELEQAMPAKARRRHGVSIGQIASVVVCCAIAFVLGLAPVMLHGLTQSGNQQSTYTSTTFHFSISYPSGWVVNTAPDASQIIPLTILITRSTPHQSSGSLESTFTVAVLSLADKDVAASAAKLPKDTTKRHITLAGLPAYADKPNTQQVPGTTATATHADYFFIHGAYEYQLSTDTISSDHVDAAMQSMLQSFAIAG
jgi:hypothetical protein